MHGLVTNKPFQRIKRQNNIGNQIAKKVKLIYPKINFPIQYLWIVLIIVVFVFGISFIINNTLLKPENYVKNISYGKYSVDMYDDPTLYKKIGELIRGENFYVVSKLKKGKVLSQLKEDFIMVKGISIVQPEKYSASVQLEFYEPDIVVKLGDKKFGVIGGKDFEIFSGNKIGEDTFFVELPQYVSGLNSLYGLFYEIPIDKFIYDMTTIAEGFPNYKRIVYLPGALMTVVFLSEEKKVYLNNQNSITGQIELYNNLNTFYDGSNSLNIIDLGSLENNMIIVQ